MDLKPMDIGVCGAVQMLYVGKVEFDATDVATGIELAKVPANTIITRAVAVVKTAFNAETTNVVTVGTNDDVNDLLGATAITEGTKGAYSSNTFVDCAAETTIKAKFTQSGEAATAGEAEIYIEVVRRPE